MTRELFGCLVVYYYRSELFELIEKIISDREAVTCFDGHWILTQRHCKREFIVLVVITVVFILAFLFVVFVSIFLFPNHYHVPFNYGIVGLPESYPFITWMINYVHQLYYIIFLYLCYLLKLDLTMIIMNHSCWLIDSTLVFVDALDESLIEADDSSSTASVVEQLRKIKEMVEAVVDWQQRACKLLALNFLGIFLLQCTANCLLFFLFSTNTTNSYVAVYGLLLMLNEIFVYCWM